MTFPMTSGTTTTTLQLMPKSIIQFTMVITTASTLTFRAATTNILKASIPYCTEERNRFLDNERLHLLSFEDSNNPKIRNLFAFLRVLNLSHDCQGQLSAIPEHLRR